MRPSTRPPSPPAGGAAVELSAVLLDLDGTITDSAPAIVASFSATFADLGIAVPDHATLMGFVGPPLADTFAHYAGLTGPEGARAAALYRSHYRELMHRAPVYEGMPELVRSLHDAGVPLALATSKRESLARQIIERAGLGPCFTAVAGAADDDRGGAKATVIARALTLLSAAGAGTGRTVHAAIAGTTSTEPGRRAWSASARCGATAMRPSWRERAGWPPTSPSWPPCWERRYEA